MSIIKRYLSNIINKDNVIDKEENFRIGQQIIITGSWTHDIQNDEVFLSDEVYRILECSPKEFGGELEEYYQYVHPDDLKEAMEATQGALEGKEYNIEYRIITPNGIEKYVHERTKVIYDKNNKPARMIGIIQDISNRKIVENNLRELGDNLNMAEHVSGVGSWKYDVKKDENFWSDEVYNIFNIEPVEFDRSLIDLIDLIHPEDRHDFHDDIKKGLKGKSYKHEYRIPQPNGSDKYVVSKGEPIFDANNCVIGIIGVIQDISEQKKLQMEIEKKNNELIEYNKRINLLVHASSDVFEIIDTDGTIKYISEAVENVIGFKVEEIIGKNVLDFYEANEKQKLSKMIELTIKGPSKKIQDTLILRNKDEKEIYLEFIMKNFISEPNQI